MRRWFIWSFLLLAIAGVLTAFALNTLRRPAVSVIAEAPPAVQKRPMAPGFAGLGFIDQEGRPFDENLLHGRAWVADFIFTSCAGTCPAMSEKMALLQKRLPAEVLLVSFSVDPKRDTPRVLSEYARRYGAQPGRWLFLTATTNSLETDETLLYRFVQYGFGLNAVDGGGPEEPIIHSVRFVLVDRDGAIHGYYDSTDPSQFEQLVRDAASL